MTFDIIISGGDIVDGSGGEVVRGDIGITGDRRIAAMGDLSEADAAGRTAGGQFYCPFHR